MIIEDSVNRFASSWGVNPLSVSLAADWTNQPSDQNIEMVGKSFSTESAFGDGLGGLIRGGLGTLQDVIDGVGVGLPNPLEWDWHEWLLAAGGGYLAYKMLFSASGKKRREQGKLEREIYKNQLGEVKKKYRARKKAVATSYPLLSF